MRSAYRTADTTPHYELTRVEPGSRMGKLLRRYWQPVCTSDELQDLPKKVKLLCEELVVFRDKKRCVGALDLVHPEGKACLGQYGRSVIA